MNILACLSVKQPMHACRIPVIVGGQIVRLSVHKARIINCDITHSQCLWDLPHVNTTGIPCMADLSTHQPTRKGQRGSYLGQCVSHPILISLS